MDKTRLTRPELAARWRMQPHSLDNLAARNEGPPYMVIGRQALYDLADVEAYERARLIDPSARNVGQAA